MTNKEIYVKIQAHENTILFLSLQISKLRKQLNYTNISVEELLLSVRSANCLQNKGIETIGQLLQYTANDLLKIKNFSRGCLNEIRETLEERYLYLKGDK